MPKTTPIDILDELASRGIETVDSAYLQELLGKSPQATSNLATRWVNQGFVDRVAPGRYVLRNFGLLGTRASSEDIALAVGALLADEPHRIAYRSALDYQDLLTHPARRIQVAASRRVQVSRLSGRPLQIIREPEDTVRIGAEQVAAGAWISGHERALIDAGSRPGLSGGALALAEALNARRPDAAKLQVLAERLKAYSALRRIGSVADVLEISVLAEALERPARGGLIWLDPQEESVEYWRDHKWGIRWNRPPGEVVAITET